MTLPVAEAAVLAEVDVGAEVCSDEKPAVSTEAPSPADCVAGLVLFAEAWSLQPFSSHLSGGVAAVAL